MDEAAEPEVEQAARLFILMERVGFVFKRYEPQAWWYELVIMGRKALLVLFSIMSK